MQQAIYNAIKTTPRNTTCLLALALWLTTLSLPGLAQAFTRTVPAQYTTIQAAINASSNGDTVLVSDGTYTGPGNVDLDFEGKSITVTSQNGPAKTIINCQGSSSANHRGFYLYSGESNAVISGLTVENGYENSDGGGGAIYVGVNNTLTLTNCTLAGDTADNGGGIYNLGTLSLTNCTLSGNTATNEGGGIFSSSPIDAYATVTLTNCMLLGNSAHSGGGIVNSAGNLTLTSCTLIGNSAFYFYGGRFYGAGGGIYNNYGSSTLTNCTLSGNFAGGIDAGSGIYNGGPLTLTNNILYDGAINNNSSGSVSASHCDIQGGYTGTGNINADPLFVRSPNLSNTPPDYGDLHLQAGSPCLGAGTASGAATTTLDGYTRPDPPSIGADELALFPPPTDLTATAGPGKVSLAWTAPAGFASPKYNLYRSTAAGTETLYYSNINATSFVNTNVTAGTKYFYTVKTVAGSQFSAPSNEASATPAAAVPQAPTNVEAVAADTKVTLTWTASPGTVTSYSVYRGTSTSSLTFYKTAGTSTSFVNTYVVNGTTYYYAIVAINSAGSSPQSAVVSAKPLAVPGAPSHLTAVASSGKVTLNWTASTGTVTSYSVYRGITSGGETFYKTTNTATMFVNTYVTHGTKYYYTIKALNASGTSAASNEASAMP